MEVPKFGSFKPKKKASLVEDQTSSVKEKETSSRRSTSHRVDKSRHSGDRDSHHHSHRDHHKEKQRHHYQNEDHHIRNRDSGPRNERQRTKDAAIVISLKQERETADEQSVATIQHELEESSLFIVDRRGDSKNVEFGSLHRYSVPAYRRTGYGNLIGRPVSSKIDRETSNEKEVFLVDAASGKRTHQKAGRLLSSKYGKNSETRLKFVSAVGPDVQDGEETDFIELSSLRKRKRGSESPEVNAGVDYRSIEGKAKTSNKPADEDVKYASDSDGVEHRSLDLRARQESAILSKKAKTSPLVLDSWLELAKHQSQLIRPGTDPAVFTTSERGTLAELRLSILNEAGRQISAGKPGREQLLLSIIEEGAPLWDKMKLAAKWKEILKECPSSMLLWTRYMDFVQYDISSFQYEMCKEAYLMWLQVLKSAHETSSGDERERVSKTQIYALLRYTIFIRDAGYDELATSIWQVLLELHFLAPKETERSSLEARLESLEDYWDMETPRIGEEGTMTWAGFHDSGPSNATTRPSAKQPEASIDSRTPFASFAREEATIAKTFLLPASTEDEDAILDPFRCIMFDDLRMVVELLSMDLPKHGLIDAFIHFSGLPPLLRGDVAAPAWSQDPHLAVGAGSIKMRAQRQTTFDLFESAIQPFSEQHAATDGRFVTFVDNVLGSLMQVVPDEYDAMREYFLAFKAKMFPNEASKAAKKLLKSRPTSLRLYNAFALIEAQAGRSDKAMGVWTAALGILPKLDVVAQDDAVLLWHSRMLAQVYQDDETSALQVLLTIYHSGKPSGTGDEQNPTHIAQLRLRRELEAGFDRMLLSGKTSHAVLYADLLAWLTYLTQDITNAISSYNLHITSLTRSGTLAAMEELQQCKARLLTLHINRQRPYKPATFQHEITHALQQFPSNSVLLELHSRIASQDRLRSLVTEQKRSSTSEISVVEWRFRLAAEIERVGDISTGGGTVNTVRATFPKALMTSGSGVAHSVALWEAWSNFELGRGNDRKRARNVFLDGLRALPGVKRWAVRGMSEELLEEGEMRRIWEGMVERGLRIRVGVEDVL